MFFAYHFRTYKLRLSSWSCGSPLRVLLLCLKVTTNSHGATARVLRRARSLQKARRALCKFTRRHSESSSTRAILAEGSAGTLQIRPVPQRERLQLKNRKKFAVSEHRSRRSPERVALAPRESQHINHPDPADRRAGNSKIAKVAASASITPVPGAGWTLHHGTSRS